MKEGQRGPHASLDNWWWILIASDCLSMFLLRISTKWNRSVWKCLHRTVTQYSGCNQIQIHYSDRNRLCILNRCKWQQNLCSNVFFSAKLTRSTFTHNLAQKSHKKVLPRTGFCLSVQKRQQQRCTLTETHCFQWLALRHDGVSLRWHRSSML